MKFTEEEKKDYGNKNRWNICGNKRLDFKNIENKEYFYYSINSIIVNNFKDSFFNKQDYQLCLINFSQLLNDLNKNINKNDKKYSDLFEYIILFVLTVQKNGNLQQFRNINLYKAFIKAISDEINPIKSMEINVILYKFK